jgi:hypothetical protein
MGHGLAGQIKNVIDRIIEQRARGNPTIATITKTKFILKGVNPDRFDDRSPDDPALLAKIRTIAAEMGVSI